MRKDLQRLYDSLDADAISSEEFCSDLRAALMGYSDLLDLCGEKERASTEMAIQYSEMKTRLSGAEKENELLKKENLRLTEQLNLRKKDLFGRASEKTSGIIGTALADEVYEDPLSEDLIPGVIPENDAYCGVVRLRDSNNAERKKKGKRKKDLSGCPKEEAVHCSMSMNNRSNTFRKLAHISWTNTRST